MNHTEHHNNVLRKKGLILMAIVTKVKRKILPDSSLLHGWAVCAPAATVFILFMTTLAPAQKVQWSVEMAKTIMTKYPNPWNYPYRDWCYPQGHMLIGFDILRKFTGDADKKYYNYILKYANYQVESSGTVTRFSGNSMDDMMAGAIVCWAWKETAQAKYKTGADKIRAKFNDYPRTSDQAFWHSRTSTGQFWIDGVFMGEMFLSRYGKYVGDSVFCYNEVARQLKLAYKHFKKGATNLLLHAWDESPSGNSWANQTTGLSSEVWAEGMGWYANMLVEALDFLPKTHKDYDSLVIQLKNLALGLKNYQDTSGCWWDIVDKANVGINWLDVSGTSYFLYTLQKGIDLGLLDSAVYAPVVRKGYTCLTQKKAVINSSGLVDIDYTCDGLSVQSSYDKYMYCGGTGSKAARWTKNAKEAVAAFLWATAIIEKPGYTAIQPDPRFITGSKHYSDADGDVYTLSGRKIGTLTDNIFKAAGAQPNTSGMHIIKTAHGAYKKMVHGR
jgi:rhamnogalacturonyl hydrolase YesR